MAGRGWHRSGQNVAYFSNSIRRGRRKRYSTLTFTLVAEHDHDLVHVAHCYPYTYTDLNEYLDELASASEYRSMLRINPLCKTLAGNTCFVLTITQGVESYTPWEEEYGKLQKSAAARRIMKMREFKEEAKLKVFEYVKNVKIIEGKK